MKILHLLEKILCFFFWFLLILGFDSPRVAYMTLAAALIHECGHLLVAFFFTRGGIKRLKRGNAHRTVGDSSRLVEADDVCRCEHLDRIHILHERALFRKLQYTQGEGDRNEKIHTGGYHTDNRARGRGERLVNVSALCRIVCKIHSTGHGHHKDTDALYELVEVAIKV